ncbi:monocarboxylate transporter 13-like [Ptychodera flava]|uniref:monocarboxylate transporter 13-like n=1 Tax=Ptychodera flava TaxID=63121 RepID=UPI00396A9FC4
MMQRRQLQQNIKLSDMTRADNRKNGGIYGWLVVLGSHICCAFIFGVIQSIGPLFIAIQDYFDETSSRVSWIISLMVCIEFGVGPFVNICVKKIGYRLTVMSGAAMSSIGLLLSAFAPNIEFLYFSFGFLVGLGHGLVNSPAIGIMALYIKKRFALANAIALTGSGIGAIVFPPLLQLLIDSYGWRGALIVFSAVNAHMFVSASLFKSPSLQRTDHGENSALNVENVDKKSDIKNHGIIQTIRQLCDCGLFIKYPSFVVVCITVFFGIGMGFHGVPAHAIARAKVLKVGTPQEISFLASALGISSILGRATVPVILYLFSRYLTSSRLFGIALILTGVAYIVSGLCKTYVSYMAFSLVFGFLSGIFLTVIVLVLKDIVSGVMLTAALSLYAPFLATGGLIGPPCAGFIYDETGDYNNSFYFYGIAAVMAGLIILISEFIMNERQMKSGTVGNDVEMKVVESENNS